MRKDFAILCLAIFCIALFVATAHYHGVKGPQRDCAICQMSALSFAAENNTIDICQSWTRISGPSLIVLVLPDAPLARLDARAPPA